MLDWIDIASPLAVTNVLSVVSWVCGDSVPGQDRSSEFFESRGRALVACLLAQLLWDPVVPKQQKTLRSLRQGLAMPEAELRNLLGWIHQHSASDLARDYAGTLKGLVDETFSGIYANADESTAWLANPAFAAIVSGDDFRSSDLLDGKCSVFLQIPLGALQTTPAVGRTIIGALLNAAYEARDAGRKYGITLQLLYQSVGQLEAQWGKDGKRAWYDGVSHRTYAAIQDLETAKELEESFGTYAVMTATEGSNAGTSGKALELGARSRGTNVTYSEVSRPLIRRDELMNDCRRGRLLARDRGRGSSRGGPPVGGSAGERHAAEAANVARSTARDRWRAVDPA